MYKTYILNTIVIIGIIIAISYRYHKNVTITSIVGKDCIYIPNRHHIIPESIISYEDPVKVSAIELDGTHIEVNYDDIVLVELK